MALTENEAVKPYHDVMNEVMRQLRNAVAPSQATLVDLLAREWMEKLNATGVIKYDTGNLSDSAMLERLEGLDELSDMDMGPTETLNVAVGKKRKRDDSGLDGVPDNGNVVDDDEENDDDDDPSGLLGGVPRRLLAAEDPNADLARLNAMLKQSAPPEVKLEDRGDFGSPPVPGTPVPSTSLSAPIITPPAVPRSGPQNGAARPPNAPPRPGLAAPAKGGAANFFGGAKKTAVTTSAVTSKAVATASPALGAKIDYAQTKKAAAPTPSTSADPPQKKQRLDDTPKAEEEIGSDDDDDNGALKNDPTDVVYCLTEDISRKGALWKWDLAQGVMHIFGQDWVFRRARGQGKW